MYSSIYAAEFIYGEKNKDVSKMSRNVNCGYYMYASYCRLAV